MNNAEKYKEVFGHDIDTDTCPFCFKCDGCEFVEYSAEYSRIYNLKPANLAGDCCRKYWNSEYKPAGE